MVTLAMGSALLDYREAMKGFPFDFDSFEAIVGGSNAGAVCVITKLEHVFITYVGVLTLIVGHYVPVEKRAVPSAAIAVCCAIVAQAELAIASNNFAIPVYQGEFTEMLGKIAYVNVFFGCLHAIVAVGCAMGLAETKITPTKGD